MTGTRPTAVSARAARPGAGRQRRPRHARAAFTLIEVLITLVILSTGIVVVLEAFQSSASALSASRDAMRATHLIQATFEAIDREGLDAVVSGACPEPYDAYQRRVTVDTGTGSPGGSETGGVVQRILVEVWQSNSTVIFSETSYRYQK